MGGRHPHPEYNRLAAIAPVGAEVSGTRRCRGTITSYLFLATTAFQVEVLIDGFPTHIYVPIDEFVADWRIISRPTFKKIRAELT